MYCAPTKDDRRWWGWELGAERVAVVIEGWDLVQRSAPVAAWEQLGKGAQEGQEA
jgi:hypothetical protein